MGQLSTAESISLVRALGAVPHPRHRRGRRHHLQSVLPLALGAVLAGARSYAAIADWAAVADHAVAVGGPPPHASTIRRPLSRLDATALEAALTSWVLARRQAAQEPTGGSPTVESRPVLAVDSPVPRCREGHPHCLTREDQQASEPFKTFPRPWAKYVAALLSSPIGKRLREASSRGSTLPLVDVASLQPPPVGVAAA